MRERGNARHVHHNAAHVDGELALRHDLAGRMVNENFFAALRVHARQSAYFDVLVVRRGRLHLFDAVGLVVLNSDNDLLNVQPLFEQTAALDDLVGTVEHGAVVARDVAFAFRAVDDDLLNAGGILHIQLDRRRERRAAETDNAAVAHGVDEARVIGDLRGLDRVGDGHLTVRLDHDRLAGRTHKLQHGDDLLDRAGNARKHRGRDKSARFADHLTDIDVIADRNDAVGALADVHAHRNGHRCRGRHFDRLHPGGVLPMGDMYTVQVFP